MFAQVMLFGRPREKYVKLFRMMPTTNGPNTFTIIVTVAARYEAAIQVCLTRIINLY
jgi:hypothetical protein